MKTVFKLFLFVFCICLSTQVMAQAIDTSTNVVDQYRLPGLKIPLGLGAELQFGKLEMQAFPGGGLEGGAIQSKGAVLVGIKNRFAVGGQVGTFVPPFAWNRNPESSQGYDPIEVKYLMGLVRARLFRNTIIEVSAGNGWQEGQKGLVGGLKFDQDFFLRNQRFLFSMSADGYLNTNIDLDSIGPKTNIENNTAYWRFQAGVLTAVAKDIVFLGTDMTVHQVATEAQGITAVDVHLGIQALVRIYKSGSIYASVVRGGGRSTIVSAGLKCNLGRYENPPKRRVSF
jgi:hypothetical protein